MMEYSKAQVLNILKNYGDLKEPAAGHTLMGIDWQKGSSSRDGKFTYGIAITADLDVALDKIGDKKNAWHSFVANYADNLSINYPASLSELNSLQCIAAELIRTGERHAGAQGQQQEALAHQIANILNGPYHKNRANKILPGGTKMDTPTRFELHLDAAARERLRDVIGDSTEAKTIRQLVDAVAGMDKESFDLAQKISAVEGVPLSVLIRNSLMAWLIRVDEHIILHGRPNQNDVLVFANGNSNEFEAIYRPVCRRDLEMAACQSIIMYQEIYGIPLEAWQKELLIRNRQGRAWLESDECKADAEQQKAANAYAKKRKAGEKPK